MKNYPYTFNISQFVKINKFINKYILEKEIKVFEIGSKDAADAFLLSTLNNKLKIISFDAGPYFKELSENFLKMSDRIVIEESIISDVSGKVEFFVTRNHRDNERGTLGSHASSILKPIIGIEGLPIKSFKTQLVNSLTGKDAIKKFFVPSVLIIDVQGAELVVLKSFENYLNKVDLIFTEVNFKSNLLYIGDKGSRSLIKYLLKNGLHLIEAYNISTTTADMIFSKKRNILKKFNAILKIFLISKSKFLLKKIYRLIR